MKRKAIAILLYAATLFFFCGCEKNEGENSVVPTGGIITNIRQYGNLVTNPINANLCLDSASAARTLSTLRRVSDRFYYMDFLTDLKFEDFVRGNYRDREQFLTAFEDFMFTPEGQEDPFDSEHPSCSGFVCYDESGGVLFGRNFDGTGGPLCMIFNTSNGKYKYVQFTAPNYNSPLYNGYVQNQYNGDGILSDGETSLHRLMREPMSTMDGMNECGLCFGAFQLPEFGSDQATGYPIRVMQNEAGKNAISTSLLHSMILGQCATVEEVEAFFKSYNFVALHPSLNVHWLVADATGDWAVFEYWNDTLYVMRANDRFMNLYNTSQVVPFEYNSIENYYCNPIATSSYMDDLWQYAYSSKVRLANLMVAYADNVHMKDFSGQYLPVMNEMKALECLQKGSFGIEVAGEATNWSCVYNPKEHTILFNMRNDMSQIYKIDLKADMR